MKEIIPDRNSILAIISLISKLIVSLPHEDKKKIVKNTPITDMEDEFLIFQSISAAVQSENDYQLLILLTKRFIYFRRYYEKDVNVEEEQLRYLLQKYGLYKSENYFNLYNLNIGDFDTAEPLNVFLCYSSKDKNIARDLFMYLTRDGLDLWFDEVSLLPGQDWELEIKKAIKKSDAVIICLSQKSVSKSGFINKEIKYALNIADEQPESAIFIIPIRIDECEIPEQLRKWHWLDLNDDSAYKKLIKSLNTRALEVGKYKIHE